MYLGRSAEAIECLQFAQSLSPDDPLSYFCSIGTGAANFELYFTAKRNATATAVG